MDSLHRWVTLPYLDGYCVSHFMSFDGGITFSYCGDDDRYFESLSDVTSYVVQQSNKFLLKE